MNILIIDTATPLESVILYTNGSVLIKTIDAGSNHSALLFDNIKALLDEAAIGITEINALAVGTGPGSFTGIRIAISTARMLAQVLGLPLVGIKTHEMLAASIMKEEGSFILTAFDAKKSRVYGTLYVIEGGKLRELVTSGDYAIETLLESCPADARLYAIGNGAEKYREEIEARVKDFVFIENLRFDGIKISNIVIERLKEDVSHDYNNVLPFYAREPDAVIPSP